jgi:hypothetical protein
MKRPSKLHNLAVAVSLFLLIAPGAGMAAPIQGLGAQACASFASNFKQNPMMEKFYFTWAQGYMSGLNMGLLAIGNEMTDLRNFDIDRQQSFIRRFCDQHPLRDYTDAVDDLFTTMRGKQGL